MSARQIALERDEAGTDWPIPTANIATLSRKLRSSKGELLVHLSDPKTVQGAASAEPQLEVDDDQFEQEEVFEKDPRQHQAQIQGVKVSTRTQSPVRTQPVATPERQFIRPVTIPQPALSDQVNPVGVNLAPQAAPDQDNPGDNVGAQVADPQPGPGSVPLPAPQPQQPARRNMAEERVLIPQPFTGAIEEDPAEFWRRIETFVDYKEMAEAEQLKLAKAMLVGGAQDWLEKLEAGEKNSMANLKKSFSERYIKPPVLRFRSAYDMFQKKQAESESVDQYASRLRSLAKRVDINDTTLLYAFVSGLKGKLASFVLGKNPANLEAAINDARIAEMSLGEPGSNDTGLLTQQLSEMRKDLQKLAQRYDSVPASASATIQRERPKSPGPRVTFQETPVEGDEMRPGPMPGPTGYDYRPQSPGNYRAFERPRGRGRGYMMAQNWRARGRGYFRGNGRGEFQSQQGHMGGFQPQQSYMPPQDSAQFAQYSAPAQPTQLGGMSEPKCGKCGLNRHSNVIYCPANSAQCLYCGRTGHYRRCCRQRKAD